MPEPKPEREPRALSTEYHKARKQLMLWAGILFIWELVGIDLEKAKETGGNAGAIITAIKSPQAVPWVLLILVAYLLFKTTIEWYQCSGARRNLRVSRIDFGSAWFVSLGAYALYIYQAVRKVQVADLVQGSNGGAFAILSLSVVPAFTSTLSVLQSWLWMRSERPKSAHYSRYSVLALLPGLSLMPIFWLTMKITGIGASIPRTTLGMGVLIGVVAALAFVAAANWAPRFWRLVRSLLFSREDQ